MLGLPGNPVAAFICALIFGRPPSPCWPRGMGGANEFHGSGAFEKNKHAGRREYLRARLTPEGHAEVFRSEGSGGSAGFPGPPDLSNLPMRPPGRTGRSRSFPSLLLFWIVVHQTDEDNATARARSATMEPKIGASGYR